MLLADPLFLQLVELVTLDPTGTNRNGRARVRAADPGPASFRVICCVRGRFVVARLDFVCGRGKGGSIVFKSYGIAVRHLINLTFFFFTKLLQ